MGFDIKSILGTIGEVALGFIPGANPVLKVIAGVAKAVGGDAGKKIEDGISAISEGLATVGKTPLSPEQQLALEVNRNQTEIELAEIKYKDKALNYDDAIDSRSVIKTALVSDDPVVRQARPKMMVLLGKTAVAYTIGTPLFIGFLSLLKVDSGTIKLLVHMILWQGGTLWSAFMTSFTGYTIARSADKRSVVKMENGEMPSKLLDMVSKIGKKIS